MICMIPRLQLLEKKDRIIYWPSLSVSHPCISAVRGWDGPDGRRGRDGVMRDLPRDDVAVGDRVRAVDMLREGHPHRVQCAAQQERVQTELPHVQNFNPHKS